VLTLCNDYRSRCNGELRVVTATRELLESRGIENVVVVRSSKGIAATLRGKARAFVSGPYSRTAYREIARTLVDLRPDVVHAHNLYPLLSPSVLAACRSAGVPVAMTVHNFALTCPHWHHFHAGRVCERCLGGREHSCVLHNCRGNLLESVGYALRAVVARKLRLFHGNVTVLITLTRFAARRFGAAGFAAQRIVVLPNPAPAVASAPADAAAGRYVAYAGRMSEEKGVSTLLAAIARTPEIELHLAGEGPLLERLVAAAPANARFSGFLDADELSRFYRAARFLVVPSLWFEMCPMVILEAMSHGVPVIASRIGGLPELVEDGVTGMLVTPGDDVELSRAIATLWHGPELCRRMGVAARERAMREHGPDVYFDRLMAAYERARSLPPPSRSA
jgi:glycosyltransferase involved in cell wall biosynthesis